MSLFQRNQAQIGLSAINLYLYLGLIFLHFEMYLFQASNVLVECPSKNQGQIGFGRNHLKVYFFQFYVYLFQILKCICITFWTVFVTNFKVNFRQRNQGQIGCGPSSLCCLFFSWKPALDSMVYHLQEAAKNKPWRCCSSHCQKIQRF